MSMYSLLSVTLIFAARRIKLDILGLFGFVLAGYCHYRLDSLEKKLKAAGVFDKNFSSKNETME